MFISQQELSKKKKKKKKKKMFDENLKAFLIQIF